MSTDGFDPAADVAKLQEYLQKRKESKENMAEETQVVVPDMDESVEVNASADEADASHAGIETLESSETSTQAAGSSTFTDSEGSVKVDKKEKAEKPARVSMPKVSAPSASTEATEKGEDNNPDRSSVSFDTEEGFGEVEEVQKTPKHKQGEHVESKNPFDTTPSYSYEVDKESEADQESLLKEMLAKKKAEKENVDVDEDDPFDGDMMARKYLGGLQKYLERKDVADIKEIVINRPEEVGLEYASGEWVWMNDPEMTQDYLEDMARMLANRSGQLFHAGNPILSVKMAGGHRVQIVAGFNAPSGFIFSMRLQRKEKFGLEDFVMDEAERERVKELCRAQKTMIVSGGTGTGKTSFLNALIPNIPEHERLITMEDVPELRIPHKNWAQMVFGGNDTTVGDQGVIALLNACLRLRPDRIILGEIRKENAFAFCSAINTGHEGSLATVHANTPKMAIDAVLNRVMMNGDMPDSAITVLRRQLLEDVKAIVQLTREGKHVKAYIKELSPDDPDLKV